MVQRIEKYSDRHWGFAYLRPRTEKQVAEILAGRNIPVYLPLINKARSKDLRRKDRKSVV